MSYMIRVIGGNDREVSDLCLDEHGIMTASKFINYSVVERIEALSDDATKVGVRP